ncbi:MAG: CHAP domain-containing protein, partial [Anaerolineae bacterium]|nr:CHAP domain-containing protein [Thermoflexales bacterium]MDW8407225.1 CHAP domain-containing protein [Anaerolineae bacterium]
MKRKALILARALFFAAATVLAQSTAHAQIQLGQLRFQPADQSQQNLPNKEHRVLAGKDWLGGRGVDAFYKNRNSCSFECEGTTKLNTCHYQCVDLVVRLYNTVGYPQWSLNGRLVTAAAEMEEVARQKTGAFADLEFYPNDGTATRPPAPGNLLIFAADSSNGGFGHVAVVNKVSGNMLEIVQQNLCIGGAPLVRDYALIEVNVSQGRQTFRVRPRRGYSPLRGWIHSKRVKERLIDQKPMVKVEDISWNRDDTAVYLYLSPERTRLLAFGELSQVERIVDLLDQTSALNLTKMTVYSVLQFLTDSSGELKEAISFLESNPHHVLRLAREWIRTDPRLNPENGVRSVDITIKYTGRMYWLRPWGGPADSKWIPFTAASVY